MQTIYYDVHGEDAHDQCGAQKRSLDDLLGEADVVSLHVPLLKATHHLLNEENLALMKSTAYLINTARGPIVDEKALLQALKKQQLAGAGLDVFENEPKFTKGLDKLVNVILTPHIASATHEAREEMSITAAQNIIEAFSGEEPKNKIG
jgi:glyoxylate reductase